jgi:hypothetical protein
MKLSMNITSMQPLFIFRHNNTNMAGVRTVRVQYHDKDLKKKFGNFTKVGGSFPGGKAAGE